VNQHSLSTAGPVQRSATRQAEQIQPAGRHENTAIGRSRTIEGAIAQAAQRTSVDFDYLVAQAQVESAMNPSARASTSSASGLYQFIESTWLETMRRHGARFGLGEVASQIGTSHGGAAAVADPARREAILALRSDPQIASLMAAGLAEDNRAHLTPILGREPDDGELYLAHFLGAGGAGRFLSAMAHDPKQSAADLFRKPAAANPSIFFEAGGAPRSLSGVMDLLSARLERARGQAVGLETPIAFPLASARPAATYPQAGAPSGLRDSSTATLPALPALPGAPELAVEPISRKSMSGLLASAFDGAQGLASPRSANQVRSAYEQLRAFEL